MPFLISNLLEKMKKKKNICFWSAIWNFIWFHSHIHKIHQFQEIYTYVLGICSPFLGMSSSFGSCFSGSWVGDLYKVGVPVIVDVQRSCLFGHVFQRTACFTLFIYWKMTKLFRVKMNGYIENDDKNKHISLVFFFFFIPYRNIWGGWCLKTNCCCMHWWFNWLLLQLTSLVNNQLAF